VAAAAGGDVAAAGHLHGWPGPGVLRALPVAAAAALGALRWSLVGRPAVARAEGAAAAVVNALGSLEQRYASYLAVGPRVQEGACLADPWGLSMWVRPVVACLVLPLLPAWPVWQPLRLVRRHH
jgi:hypothetical protein